MDVKEDLLKQLEMLSDREASDHEAKTKRRELWDKLLPMFDPKDANDVIQYLSSELQLSPVTIRRWVAGEFNPRNIHLSRLRSLLGMTQRVPDSLSGQRPDPPVAFDGAFAAIRTLNHFFYCLKLAECAFFFKGKLAYQAGRPGSARETVLSILGERTAAGNPLILYYFFIGSSPAEATLVRFLKSPRVEDSRVYANKLIRPFSISSTNDELGLAHSPVSPLILVYNDQGRRIFDRLTDVFFELPVEFVQPDNLPIDHEYSAKTVLVQQPEPQALTFCQEVADFLRRLKKQDAMSYVGLEEQHLEMPILSWSMLEK